MQLDSFAISVHYIFISFNVLLIIVFSLPAHFNQIRPF